MLRKAAAALAGHLDASRAAKGCCSAVVACIMGAASPSYACTGGDRTLNYGFYAFFEPLSYSADGDPASAGYGTHRGYEADLLSALEAMRGGGLSFSRRPIGEWDGIWLRPATPEFDIVGGGITILESRTRDRDGRKAVVFTSGHIAFRQSLLVRAHDAGTLTTHADLGRDVKVGVLAGTTGEARLLQLTGLSDGNGVLVKGARVETPNGTVTADGTTNHVIASAGASPKFRGRRLLRPPADGMPTVVYLGDERGEGELLEALRDGGIDAVARGEIGNRDAARASGGLFAVTALDPKAEHGGFALALRDADLAACLNDRIGWLTDGRRIGYSEWRANPKVFLERAALWKGGP